MNALFDGLFFEGSRNRGNVACLLDEDSDDESGNQGIGRLFDSCSSAHEKVVGRPDELPEIEAKIWFFSNVEPLLLEGGTSLAEERCDYVTETDDEKKEASSSVSSVAYEEVYVPRAPITECPDCQGDYWYLGEPINESLAPLWKWVPRLTRWPFRFAPQQNVDVSMSGIQVPPRRASSGRLMLGVCRFCAKNQNITNLVPLDPMVSHLID